MLCLNPQKQNIFRRQVRQREYKFSKVLSTLRKEESKKKYTVSEVTVGCSRTVSGSNVEYKGAQVL